MHKRMKTISAVVLVLALVLCLVYPAERVSADKLGQLQEELDKLESQKKETADKIAELESQLSSNATQIQEVAAQKALIDQEIFLMYEQIAAIDQQIQTLERMIADKQDALVKAQTRLSELSAKNKERIRAMEENGNLSYWSVLFKANSFADLLDRLNMIQEIAEADRQRLKEMNQAAQEVADARQELYEQKDAQEAVKAELTDAQKALEGKRADADALLSQLNAKGAEFQSLLAQSEDAQSELLDEIAKVEKEYDAEEYRQWLATSEPETTQPTSGGSTTVTPPASSGDWLVPINYDWFTSPFGYRWHPKSGVWKMHYGVDLAASTGTPIVASRSGVIRTTDYEEGGAGYYVSINHGDGYASIYMHMTHYIVSPGDYVSAGQVIGYCGSTGLSTGPHLHFGISYNGTYVNPADYIDI